MCDAINPVSTGLISVDSRTLCLPRVFIPPLISPSASVCILSTRSVNSLHLLLPPLATYSYRCSSKHFFSWWGERQESLSSHSIMTDQTRAYIHKQKQRIVVFKVNTHKGPSSLFPSLAVASQSSSSDITPDSIYLTEKLYEWIMHNAYSSCIYFKIAYIIDQNPIDFSDRIIGTINIFSYVSTSAEGAEIHPSTPLHPFIHLFIHPSSIRSSSAPALTSLTVSPVSRLLSSTWSSYWQMIQYDSVWVCVSGWWDRSGPGALGIKTSIVAAVCLEIMSAASPSAVHLHI